MKTAGSLILAGALIAMSVTASGLSGQDKMAKKAGASAGEHQAGMEMSGPMKLKCQMMMKAEVNPTDPAALLAVGEQLELSEQQTEKLEQILADARSAAEKLLKPQQRQKLEGLENLPGNHMAMHQMMMEKMKGKMGEKMQGKMGGKSGEKSGEMMCPMMRAMQGEKDKPGSEATHGAKHSEHGHDH